MANPQQARHAFISANDFHLASLRCLDPDLTPGGPSLVSTIPGPQAVCAAFAAELYLKSLILRRLDEQEGHNLAWLFNSGLDDAEREAVRAEFEKQEYVPVSELPHVLDNFARTFTEWRYLYTQPTTQLDIGALSAFARALYHTVRSLEAEWPVSEAMHERLCVNNKNKKSIIVHVGADLALPPWVAEALGNARPPQTDLAQMEGKNLSLTAPTVNLDNEAAALKIKVGRGSDRDDTRSG